MKVTLIGHASILVEVGGIRIVSDPWWKGPCFGAQWWIYPQPEIEAVTRAPVDYVYISHGHNDHFHPGTLKTFSRETQVLVSKHIGLASAIGDLGFKVIALGEDDCYDLGNGSHCRIMPTHGDDTLMVISDGAEICVNLNDSLHSAPRPVQERFIARLKALYPALDYVFCGYGIASHFPNCYVIAQKDRQATAARRQAYFNSQWARIVAGLSPKFAFPFAADVVFFEDDLFWSNEPVHNSERPTAAFRQRYRDMPTRVFDIAPGFAIKNGEITSMTLREPLRSEDLKRLYPDSIARANRYGGVSDADVAEARDLLARNCDFCHNYFAEYRGDYRLLIRFRNSDRALTVVKAGEKIDVEAAAINGTADYDLVYTTRLAYLKWSLTTDYGHEILFVGSGGIFEYVRAAPESQLHRELMVMVRKRETPPTSRFGDASAAVYRVKQAVKTLLGKKPSDLYDLDVWTIFRH